MTVSPTAMGARRSTAAAGWDGVEGGAASASASAVACGLVPSRLVGAGPSPGRVSGKSIAGLVVWRRGGSNKGVRSSLFLLLLFSAHTSLFFDAPERAPETAPSSSPHTGGHTQTPSTHLPAWHREKGCVKQGGNTFACRVLGPPPPPPAASHRSFLTPLVSPLSSSGNVQEEQQGHQTPHPRQRPAA